MNDELEANVSVAIESLSRQLDDEIFKLRDYLNEMLVGDCLDPDTAGEISARIFYTSEGLQKLASVMGYLDCWVDNGDPPKLNGHASFNDENRA